MPIKQPGKLFKGVVVVVQSLSHVWLVTTWTAAHQLSLSFTISRSLLKLMSFESVILTISSATPFFCLQSFPASGSFPISQFFPLGGQSTGVSASAVGLPMNIQHWLPLGWTLWISLLSKKLSSLLQQHSSKVLILQCSQDSSFVTRFARQNRAAQLH